jgi:hypothetical protein
MHHAYLLLKELISDFRLNNTQYKDIIILYADKTTVTLRTYKWLKDWYEQRIYNLER